LRVELLAHVGIGLQRTGGAPAGSHKPNQLMRL
jgi:hypothetical protein